MVLLQQPKTHQLNVKYKPQKFTIINKNRNTIMVKLQEGETSKQNAQTVKSTN